MPVIGMEDIRIPVVVATLLVIALFYVTMLKVARRDEDVDQVCPICGDRRDQAPVEHWRPGSRYCETCGRVTHRDTELKEPVGAAGQH